MFTPIKPKGCGVLNDTVLNTPQPQATSTVCRKSTLESRFSDKLHSVEERGKQDTCPPCESEPTQREDSSLGLLDDMSVLMSISTTEDEQKSSYPNTDADLEYASHARRLLQRCSDVAKHSSLTTDMDKENNANVQNITGNMSVPNFTLPIGVYEFDREYNMNHSMSKVSTTSVTFEPNEITARSSGVSCSAKRQLPTNQSFIGISFNKDDMMAQVNDDTMMAQINNEEFLSSSKCAEQLSMDQAYWQQNRTYCMPVASTDKQKIDFSTLSGIIGDLDLTVESCAGRKVSVGKYFERKSDNIGLLGNNEKMRANLCVSETPVKTGKLPALAESTVLTDAMASSEVTELTGKEHTLIPSATRDVDENSIISLSTIVNTLQDVNSGTPRRLVDQLLMAQKKKRHSLMHENARKETYTLPSDKSVLATSIRNSNIFDEIKNLSAKLSLDNRTKNEATSEIVDVKQECMTASSFSSQNAKKAESFANTSKQKILKDEACSENIMSSLNRDLDVSSTSDRTFSLRHSTLPCSDKLTALSNVPYKMNRNYDEESYKNLNIRSEEEIPKKDIPSSMIDSSLSLNTNMKVQSDLNKNVILGSNTDKSCNCIVGMTNEVNVELVNNGERWITYTFKLIEVVGDAQSIELNIPSGETLINPNGVRSTKIEMKVTKPCKPIFVVLNIFLSDMVAKSKWCMKHMIFVSPEQLDLDVICPFNKSELDFQYVAEEITKVLPVTFHNKNNVDVPVKLSIHDDLKLFSIDEPTHLILKPLEKFTTNVKCEKSRSTSLDSPQRQPQHWTSRLIIDVQYKDAVLFRKEVPLYAQIGVCKIQIIDTEIPIVVPREQGKLVNIINSGNVVTHVFATVVPMEGHPNATQDFFIKPESIFLQVGERSSFLIVYKPQLSDASSIDKERYAKIKLIAGNNVYHYIISTEPKLLESDKENFRCHTPNNVVSPSPATSPQSIASNRSGPCDRNSPISTVSSIAAAGNIVPIKSTHAALVWNSVKTGKSETKEFMIRNTSNNRIKIQIDICDDSKSFKFLEDKQIDTSKVLALQRQESKTLVVAFSPYYVGPVVGKITIKHYTKGSSDSQQYKKISLYGYGGYSKVKILGTAKDASRTMWLSLGNLYSETGMRANIELDNSGDLRSFAKITVRPKVLSTMNSSWHVNPKEVILDSKESRQITIQFHPKREDFALLQRSEVSHVATINITYGDEPTRWRIRRLYNKIKESGDVTGTENEAFKNIILPICKTFPGEQLISGLTLIRDPIQNLSDLCTGVHQYEIMLTVEACADDTLPVHYDTDESEMYQSLISDTTHVDEAGGASFFASQTMAEHEVQHPELQDQFTVTPSTIVLTPPIQNEATVTILSFSKVAEPFQTSLSNSNYFSVFPAEGMLPSKKSFPLKIQCSQRLERNMQAVLEIYTENNKQDVLIKVVARRQ